MLKEQVSPEATNSVSERVRVLSTRTVSDREVATEPPMEGFTGVSW